MEKKVALITGSTSGIGMGIAKRFAAEGYNIVFNGLEKNGVDIAREIGENNKVKTIFSATNMLKEEEIQEMVKQGEKEFGQAEFQNLGEITVGVEKLILLCGAMLI